MVIAAQGAQQSMVHWVLSALGSSNTVLLPLAGLLAFVLTFIVVLRGRGTLGAIALIFIVPLPFVIGIFGAIEGAIRSYSVIATSAVAPKPSEVAAGISMALVAPLVGLILMAPSYIVATFGLLARSLADDEREGRIRR